MKTGRLMGCRNVHRVQLARGGQTGSAVAGQQTHGIVCNAQGVRTRILGHLDAHCVIKENTPRDMEFQGLNQVMVMK